MRKLGLVQKTGKTIRRSFGPALTLLSLMIIAIFALKAPVLAQVNPSWIPTGSLNIPRSDHTATLLPNGKVLVVGGRDGNSPPNYLNSSELYDPATRTWSVTGSLNAPRYLHTATLLPNGKVLIAGGITNTTPPDFGITASAELYDPVTGTWSVTGRLNRGRFWHTATLLQNGKVLVAAGGGGDSSAELYDPATGNWSITGGLVMARYGQTATLLQNGKVLIVGGSDDGDLASTLASAELYDPAIGTWSVTNGLNVPRFSHTATLLPNGKVLVAGGYFPNFVPISGGFASAPTSLNGTELYDPASGTWTIAASLNVARNSHTATLLPNGKVLVAAGGYWTPSGNPPCGLTASCSFNPLSNAELYDPASDAWTITASLNTSRAGHTATFLASGEVLVAGGDILNSAELYNSSTAQISVTPSAGSGSFQTFSFTFFDPNGFADIFSATVLVHSGPTAASGCFLYYHRGINAVWLQNDSGSDWIGPSLLGSGAALQNSQCTVNAAGSSASGSGSNLTLNLALGFSSPFSGDKNIYAITYDNESLTSNWQQAGTWTVR